MDSIKTQNDLKIVYEKMNRQLLIQAYRIVSQNDIAEDIVQECFIKLWEKRKEIQTNISIEGYIKRMVRNRCLDYLRKNKVRIVEINENLNLETTEDSDQVKFEKNQKLQLQIHTTLNSLPEKCRQVFILAKYEKMSYNQISEKLDISKKTVESHMSKALKSFRINLKQFLIIILNRVRVFNKNYVLSIRK